MIRERLQSKCVLARACGVTAVLALASVGLAQTSIPGEGFTQTYYYKVPASQNAAFLEMQQGLMKKIVQQRIASGERTYWGLYSVLGAGTSGEYNYVTIAQSEKTFEPVPGYDDWQKAITGVGSKVNFGQVLNFLQPMIVRMTIGQRLLGISNPTTPPAVISVRRFRTQPGKSFVVADYHRKVMLPVAQELLKAGKILSHSVTTPIFSGSTTPDFNITVGWGYASAAEAIARSGGGKDFQAAFAKVHAGKNYSETMRELTDAREFVRGELWRMVDSARR